MRLNKFFGNSLKKTHQNRWDTSKWDRAKCNVAKYDEMTQKKIDWLNKHAGKT